MTTVRCKAMQRPAQTVREGQDHSDGDIIAGCGRSTKLRGAEAAGSAKSGGLESAWQPIRDLERQQKSGNSGEDRPFDGRSVARCTPPGRCRQAPGSIRGLRRNRQRGLVLSARLVLD